VSATSILYWSTRLQLITWFPSNVTVDSSVRQYDVRIRPRAIANHVVSTTVSADRRQQYWHLELITSTSATMRGWLWWLRDILGERKHCPDGQWL